MKIPKKRLDRDYANLKLQTENKNQNIKTLNWG